MCTSLKMVVALLCSTFIFTTSFSQSPNHGIAFEKVLNWDTLRVKAQKSNKLIFMDCFATWCIPCKQMDSEIFPLKETGDYINTRFLSVRLQMDSTANDLADVKANYNFGKIIGKKANVNAFPTYLVFDQEGQLLAKATGVMSSSTFIKKIDELLRPENQYFLLKDKWTSGNLSAESLKDLINGALKENDHVIIIGASDKYMENQKDLFTEDQLIYLRKTIIEPRTKTFDFFLTNREKISAILSPHKYSVDFVDSKLVSVIQVNLYNRIVASSKKVNWALVRSEIQKISPDLTDRVLVKLKVNDAKLRHDWEATGQFLLDEFEKYGDKLTNTGRLNTNNEIWDLFLKVNKRQTLLRAVNWSRNVIDLAEKEKNTENLSNLLRIYFMDTYANLLYKLGYKAKAIAAEKQFQKAVIMEKQVELIDIAKLTLTKMRKGAPTW